jgi:glutathione S-transferase
MKLYHDTRAPNPRRVRIYLAEKGLAARGVAPELVEVSIAARANEAPEYLAKNPLGLLPVLELDDGRLLSESIAICRFFEEQYPDPPLFGEGAWERAQVEEWNRHVELELFLPIAHTFRNTHAFWAGRIPQVAEYGEIAREHVGRRMAWLDGVLADRRYVAGERYSVADITALCCIDFGKISNIRISADHPNLARWHAEVSSRPSAKA